MRKIFLDMDGVLAKCTLGLTSAINHDLENEVNYTSKSRMKKLRKLKNYDGDTKVPITIQFLDELLAKKDNEVATTLEPTPLVLIPLPISLFCGLIFEELLTEASVTFELDTLVLISEKDPILKNDLLAPIQFTL